MPANAIGGGSLAKEGKGSTNAKINKCSAQFGAQTVARCYAVVVYDS
jgi:hypothetical protein